MNEKVSGQVSMSTSMKSRAGPTVFSSAPKRYRISSIHGRGSQPKSTPSAKPMMVQCPSTRNARGKSCCPRVMEVVAAPPSPTKVPSATSRFMMGKSNPMAVMAYAPQHWPM